MLGVKLSHKERHFLTLLNEPGATISMGTKVGKELNERGLVEQAKWGRWGITPAGIDALQGRVAALEPRSGQETCSIRVILMGAPLGKPGSSEMSKSDGSYGLEYG